MSIITGSVVIYGEPYIPDHWLLHTTLYCLSQEMIGKMGCTCATAYFIDGNDEDVVFYRLSEEGVLVAPPEFVLEDPDEDDDESWRRYVNS